uniref:Ovule protein n=1 Tax=Heterorhabditis bacteriophora TaxID=37862 RepID=A0A1I7WPZ0_HETBA
MKFKLETSKIISPHPKKDWINLVTEKREKKKDKVCHHFEMHCFQYFTVETTDIILMYYHTLATDPMTYKDRLN